MDRPISQEPRQTRPGAKSSSRSETLSEKEIAMEIPNSEYDCYTKKEDAEGGQLDKDLNRPIGKRAALVAGHGLFRPPTLGSLPGDVLGIILGNCNSITDARRLCQSSRKIKETYVEREFDILRSVISRQYNPYDEIYELAAVLSHGIVSGPMAIYIDTPINVFFQKTPSYKRVILSHARRFSQRREINVILDPLGLRLLEHICLTIDQWIDVFPQVRFRKGPPDIRRCLRPSEEKRLSRALVRWWRYSLQFHGKLGWHLSVPWDSFADPIIDFAFGSQHGSGSESEGEEEQFGQHEIFNGYSTTLASPPTEPPGISNASSASQSQISFDSEESLEILLTRNRESLYSDHSEHDPTFEPEGPDLSTGRAFMRMFSTMHLVELRDLFSCVYDMVAIDLCPSYELTVEAMGDSFRTNHASLSWGLRSQNFLIVNTYLKLPPDDLLALWKAKTSSPYSFDQTRARVREKALDMLPGLGLTRQTLGTSLDYVLRERSVLDLCDRGVAMEIAFRFGLELGAWRCWGPPTARMRYAGVLDLAGETGGFTGGEGDAEYGELEERYSTDGIRSGEMPDYGRFWIEDACWDPPRAGWTVSRRPGREGSASRRLKGDDGRAILPTPFAEMEDSEFEDTW